MVKPGGKRDPHAIYFDEPSLTKQSFKDECDINIIIERVMRIGPDALSHLNQRMAQYGDVSSVPDYRSALDAVNRAQGMFMSLDAKVRERFGNDPAKFLDFCNDGRNYAEAVALGLIQAKPESVGSSPETAKSVGKDDSGAKKSKPKGDDE